MNVDPLKKSALLDMRRKFDHWMRETEHEAIRDFFRADWKYITPTTMTTVLKTGAHAIAMEKEDKSWVIVHRPVEPSPPPDDGLLDANGLPDKESDPDAYCKALREMQDRPDPPKCVEQDPPYVPKGMDDIAFNLAKKLLKEPGETILWPPEEGLKP